MNSIECVLSVLFADSGSIFLSKLCLVLGHLYGTENQPNLDRAVF